MTLKRKNDLNKVQTYISKLQEIKSFLQQAHYEESGVNHLDLRVNCYWNDNSNNNKAYAK